MVSVARAAKIVARAGRCSATINLVYVPRANQMPDDAEIRRLVSTVGAGELITARVGAHPLATRLPLVWQENRVLLHMAIANPHWRAIAPDQPALLVVTGPEAYVSPTYYPSKVEHGRVVPTWNYSAVHLSGRLTIRQDEDWLRWQVGLLTDAMEAGRRRAWQVEDAPALFIEQQLRRIVGIEMLVEQVEGKAKLSQNRSVEDRAGVVEGLRATGLRRDADVADAMEHERP